MAEPAADAGRVAVGTGLVRLGRRGDFDSLATLLAHRPVTGPRCSATPTLVRPVDATGLVVPHSGRVVAVVGLDDVVVVDTPDAVLVTTRARAQEVKQAVQLLQGTGRAELT